MRIVLGVSVVTALLMGAGLARGADVLAGAGAGGVLLVMGEAAVVAAAAGLGWLLGRMGLSEVPPAMAAPPASAAMSSPGESESQGESDGAPHPNPPAPRVDSVLARLHAEVEAIRADERILLRVLPEDLLAASQPPRPDMQAGVRRAGQPSLGLREPERV